MTNKTKFILYEIVSTMMGEKEVFAAIRDWDYGEKEGTFIYTLRTPEKLTFRKLEEQLKSTGEFEAPFRFYEIVKIAPDVQLPAGIQNEGVVLGISVDEDNCWSFAVLLNDDECTMFNANELIGTGIVLPAETFYSGSSVRVSVDLRTEMGHLNED